LKKFFIGPRLHLQERRQIQWLDEYEQRTSFSFYPVLPRVESEERFPVTRDTKTRWDPGVNADSLLHFDRGATSANFFFISSAASLDKTVFDVLWERLPRDPSLL
jgi:hypothetical protein